MSRKNVLQSQVNEKTRLQELVISYGEQNGDLNKLKKDVASMNSEIKALLPKVLDADKNGNYTGTFGEYTATLSFQDKSTMNEERLIQWLKDHGLAKGIVRRREYVDGDALEAAIYSGAITEEQVADMDSCRDENIVQVLYVKKKKKEDK